MLLKMLLILEASSCWIWDYLEQGCFSKNKAIECKFTSLHCKNEEYLYFNRMKLSYRCILKDLGKYAVG